MYMKMQGFYDTSGLFVTHPGQKLTRLGGGRFDQNENLGVG